MGGGNRNRILNRCYCFVERRRKEEKNVSDVTVRRERGFTSSITASTSLLFISFLLFKRQNNLGRNPVPAKVSGDLLIFPNKLETITSFFFLSRGEAGSERIKGFSRLPGGGRENKRKKGRKWSQSKTSEKLRSARPRFPFYLV